MSLFRFLLIFSFLHQITLASPEKPNFQDDIVPVFEQSCNSCHNPDRARGGLDLTSMNAILAGGSSGDVSLPGDPDASLLYLLPARLQEPHMPPRGDKIENSQLMLIKNWIAQGMLPTASGKPMQKKKSSFDLALGSVSLGKPEGPPPMPKHLNLQPTLVTKRAFAPSAMASAPWSPLVALAGQKQIILYNTENLSISGILPYEEGFIESLNFSRNGKLIIASGGRGGKSGNVVGWEVESGRRVLNVGEEQDTILTSDLSADQSIVAIGGTNKLVKVFDLATNEILYKIKKHSEWVTQVSFSPDGILLATADRNGGLFVWEAKTGNPFYSLEGHKEEITSLSWRADGNVLLSASEEGAVRTWEMINGKQVKTWNAHSGGTLSAHYAPNGTIVTSGRDKSVKFWDGEGKGLRTISDLSDIVMEARLSHDGTKIIAGDWSGQVFVWNANDGKKMGSLSSNPPMIEDRVKTTERNLVSIRSNLETHQNKVRPIQQEMDRLSKLLSEEKNQLNALEDELLTLAKQLETMKQQSNSQKKESETISASIQTTQSFIQTKEKEIALNKPIISSLSAEISNFKKKENPLIQSIAKLENRLKEKSGGEDEANSTKDTNKIQEDLKIEKNHLVKLRQIIVQKNQELNTAQNKLTSLETQKSEHLSKLESLKKKHQEILQLQKDSSTSLKNLQDKIAKQTKLKNETSLAVEKHQSDLTASTNRSVTPLKEYQQIRQQLALESKQKQKWESELINTNRHQNLKKLRDLEFNLNSLELEIEEEKSSLAKAQAELDYANQILFELPEKINNAREEVQVKQRDLQDRRNDVELLKGKLGNIEALIAKTNTLLKDFSENANPSKDQVSFAETEEHFQQGLSSLKQQFIRIKDEIAQGNQNIELALNHSKQSEQKLEDAINLKSKAPGIVKDKKSRLESIRTNLENKELEWKKLKASVEEQQKRTDGLLEQYLALLPAE